MSGVLYARNRSSTPEIAGFRVQSSVYGLPIPVIYGTARVAGNLIDFVKGSTVPVTSQRAKWTSPTQTGWSYLNAVALAFGEGTIAGIGNVWADKDAKADFTTVVQPRDLWTLKVGTINQAALGFLSTAAPYQYIAYVAADALAMPNNVLPNYSWEVKGLSIFGSGVVDALPSDILVDLLIDTKHGMSFPSASIDSLSDYEDYCASAGLFFSPVYSALRKGADVIDELMLASNSALVWSDGLLKVKPYGDQALSGHGHSYTPDVNPVYDLGDGDFLGADGEDPIIVTPKNPNERFNQLTVEFENRANDYNVDIKEAKNDDSILTTRLIPAPKLSLPLIKDPNVARTVAQLQQQRAQFVVNQYGFKLGWKFSLLEPMDLVTLSDVGLGLDFTPVRITQVVELEDAAGIAITAEDWPFGAAGATLYPSQGGNGHKPDQNVTPGNTVARIIDAPSGLTNAYLGIWIGASGGVNWGGCEVWYSTDDVSYYKLGEITQKAVFGTLTADLATNARYPTVDNTHTLSVDTSVSGGSIDSVDGTIFTAELSLVWVNGEFLIYRDASLTSANHYDLTYLGRGLYGTPIANPAASGVPFMVIAPAFDATGLLTGTILRWANPGADDGDVIYFKFPAFNIYGNALQSLADVTGVAHTVTVAPSIPGNATPQGTVSFDDDGTPTLEVNGPGWVQSYMYLTSTSAFPTDAAVLAGGTTVDGRNQTITDSPVAVGGTEYATFIPFSGLQASGIPGKSIRLRGTHMALTATKTVAFSRSAFVLTYAPGTGPHAPIFDASSSPSNPAMTFGPTPIPVSVLATFIELPAGVVLVSVDYDGAWGTATNALGAFDVAFYLNNSLVNNGNFTYGGGSQTVTVSLSGTTGPNDAILVIEQWTGPLAGTADALQASIFDFYVTYTMPTSDKTV